ETAGSFAAKSSGETEDSLILSSAQPGARDPSSATDKSGISPPYTCHQSRPVTGVLLRSGPTRQPSAADRLAVRCLPSTPAATPRRPGQVSRCPQSDEAGLLRRTWKEC